MLVGAGEIDAALLVVAADDGPRAQTLEHLALLDALGIGVGVAVVTKTDVAGPERTAEVVAAVGRLLDGTSLAGSPVVAVSSVSGEGLEALRAALADLSGRVGARRRQVQAQRESRLAIDRVFAVKGRGVVVTGTLRGGPLARGATLRLVPGDRSARVREVQVHNATVEAAGPGRTALNLAGVEAGDLHRGLVLTDDPSVVASDRILVRLISGLARPRAGTCPPRHRGHRRDRRTERPGRDRAAGRHERRDPPPRGTDRGRDGRSARAPPDLGRGTDRRCRRARSARRPAAISRRRQTAERVARLAAAVVAGDASAIETARLDLHGALLPTGSGSLRIAPDIESAVEAEVLAAVDPAMDLPAARCRRRHVAPPPRDHRPHRRRDGRVRPARPARRGRPARA